MKVPAWANSGFPPNPELRCLLISSAHPYLFINCCALGKEAGREALTLTKLKDAVYEETENAGQVVEQHEFDVGGSTSSEQEAEQVHEGNGGPAVQHEDQHRVQEVVLREE